jgi:hypothetical protein
LEGYVAPSLGVPIETDGFAGQGVQPGCGTNLTSPPVHLATGFIISSVDMVNLLEAQSTSYIRVFPHDQIPGERVRSTALPEWLHLLARVRPDPGVRPGGAADGESGKS